MSEHPSEANGSPDSAEITKLVRNELDRYNKYLEFAQGQIDKDRNFYKHLYTIAAALLPFWSPPEVSFHIRP
jgi:hypothetical protein